MMKKRILPVVLLACSVLLAACDTTPPAVSALMQQVAQACQAGDQQALKACFAKEGVTADQIDSHLGSWDAYFTKSSDPQYAYTYAGIRYVSLADAPNDKSFLPDMITMAQPTTVGGVKFAPNIKVIGFIVVSFKMSNGAPVGPIEEVGIASDGSAKIALSEPQK
jgi:hypothetical protein